MNRINSSKIWLPEPINTKEADFELIREEIISYSILVIMEKLSPKERAVFVLKEIYGYTHSEVGDLINCSIESSRKLLARAKDKISRIKKGQIDNSSQESNTVLADYVEAIKIGNIKSLEKLLAEDIVHRADGGSTINVVSPITVGRSETSKLVQFVFNEFQKDQSLCFTEINHQPALIFTDSGKVSSCQVFEVNLKNNEIANIYAIVDPSKLKSIV